MWKKWTTRLGSPQEVGSRTEFKTNIHQPNTGSNTHKDVSKILFDQLFIYFMTCWTV